MNGQACEGVGCCVVVVKVEGIFIIDIFILPTRVLVGITIPARVLPKFTEAIAPEKHATIILYK